MKLPTTLQEAVQYFADPQRCLDFAMAMRWPQGPVCPRCNSLDHRFVKTRTVWVCKACQKQYTVKVGTIFEDSPIKMDKWLCAMWMMVNAKNGVSSYEIGRSLGITQKSAWFMMHRIRLALHHGSIDRKLMGEKAGIDYRFGISLSAHTFNIPALPNSSGSTSIRSTIALIDGRSCTSGIVPPRLIKSFSAFAASQAIKSHA